MPNLISQSLAEGLAQRK